jgi:hypothetical protein
MLATVFSPSDLLIPARLVTPTAKFTHPVLRHEWRQDVIPAK